MTDVTRTGARSIPPTSIALATAAPTAISPLQQRMIDDMRLRHFGAKTQQSYIRAVKNFTTFLGRSPATAMAEDLRRYQLHLTERRVGVGTINAAATALRFFFGVTLDRPDAAKALSFASPAYVTDFLATSDGLALVKAFMRIKKPKLRRRIVDLVKEIAEGD